MWEWVLAVWSYIVLAWYCLVQDLTSNDEIHVQMEQQQMSRIDDGFSTLFEFSLNPNVKLWEKDVTPPGISGGGPTPTSTMRNTQYRTFAPKGLKTLTPASFTGAYDTAVYVQLNSMININQIITITFGDGSKLRFWGWLDEFKPNRIVEGEQPTAECTVQPSNQNSSNVEVSPVYIDSENDTGDTVNP